MRYLGGVLGGSWLTAMTGDLGAGKFDGAWLVSNFESGNPANTYWTKQYEVWPTWTAPPTAISTSRNGGAAMSR